MSSPPTFPRWFTMTCCGVPLGALLAVSLGLSFGTAVSPLVLLMLSHLCWRVLSQILGIDAHAGNLLQRRSDLRQLIPKDTNGR
jgi:hypothetical protein